MKDKYIWNPKIKIKTKNGTYECEKPEKNDNKVLVKKLIKTRKY